jgi:integrase
MLARLKGVNSKRVVAADGTVKVYYYAFKGGPRLEGEPDTEEFLASYYLATKVRPADGATFEAVIDAYMDSKEFKGNAAITQSEYRRYIGYIKEAFAEFPIAGFMEDEARAEFLDWRDEMAERGTRTADYAWSVLNCIVNWSISVPKYGIKFNPCAKAGKLWKGSRAEIIWEDKQEAAFLKVASRQMRLPFMLAMWTGQRQKDILTVPWTAYTGTHLNIRQSKTGKNVRVQVGTALKALLDTTPRKGVQIVLNEDDMPYTGSGFRASFRRTRIRAGVHGVTFHDLRGTTVTLMAEGGASEMEIASITGHTIGQVKSILEKHYLATSQRLGDRAIAALEGRRNGTQ